MWIKHIPLSVAGQELLEVLRSLGPFEAEAGKRSAKFVNEFSGISV